MHEPGILRRVVRRDGVLSLQVIGHVVGGCDQGHQLLGAAGLLLNATLGWSWADPIAGLIIAGVAIREGIESWRGDACCSPLGTTCKGAA